MDILCRPFYILNRKYLMSNWNGCGELNAGVKYEDESKDKEGRMVWLGIREFILRSMGNAPFCK